MSTTTARTKNEIEQIPTPTAPPPTPPTYTIKTTPTSGTHSCGCFGLCSTKWREEFPCRVEKIFISYNNSIRSIQMVYRNDASNLTVAYPKHGGYGRHCDEIEMHGGEIITGISGRLSYLSKTLKSITFQTNYGKKGPYGGKEGRGYPFSYQFSNGINGFYGICNNTGIMSIGVIVKRQGKELGQLTGAGEEKRSLRSVVTEEEKKLRKKKRDKDENQQRERRER